MYSNCDNHTQSVSWNPIPPASCDYYAQFDAYAQQAAQSSASYYYNNFPATTEAGEFSYSEPNPPGPIYMDYSDAPQYSYIDSNNSYDTLLYTMPQEDAEDLTPVPSPLGLFEENDEAIEPTYQSPHADMVQYDNSDSSEALVSVSTTFNEETQPDADIVLQSEDNVLFYVNSTTITAACPTIFQAYIAVPLAHANHRATPIRLDSPAPQLAVILHILHDTCPSVNSPNIETLVAAVDHMPKYGMVPHHFIRQTSPIFELLLSQAPRHPLDVYALGAFHSIPDLCVGASFYTLSSNLWSITDDMSIRIGSIYMKKLLFLHMNRRDSLQKILRRPPHPHPATPMCSFKNQRRISRIWTLASASLLWESPPSITTHAIQLTLNPLIAKVSCKECQLSLEGRLKEVLAQWAVEKNPGSMLTVHQD